MLIKAKPGALKQMMKAYEKKGGNIIAVEEVDPNDVSSYGIVGRGEGDDEAFSINQMVEKPKKQDAPSNLIISGRYILQPEVFDLLSSHTKGAGGEIQITDAMQKLLKEQDFTGVKFEGKTFDCGSKIGFLSANVAYALDREDLAADFKKELLEIINAKK
jgi:UTP--glucose-1-phosphate uridylyltransferase